MMQTTRTILTYGTFDLFHIGHLRILERARALGDRLVVGVSTDTFNATKGKKSVIPFEHRRDIVAALRCVDLVIPEENWEQKVNDILRHEVRVFAMGDDWQGKFDFLAPYCEVHYLSRTPEISTTLIKTDLEPERRDHLEAVTREVGA
jgi:glycerol-3-phosphate cytidylyltransferase